MKIGVRNSNLAMFIQNGSVRLDVCPYILFIQQSMIQQTVLLPDMANDHEMRS
jgi:hypothetical protein